MIAVGAKIAPANSNEPINQCVRNTIISSNRKWIKFRPLRTMFPSLRPVCPIQHMCPMMQVAVDLSREKYEESWC